MRRAPPLGRDGEGLTCAAGERGPPLTLAMTNSLPLIIKISCLWGGHLVGVIKVTHRQRFSFPFSSLSLPFPFPSFHSPHHTNASFLPSLLLFFLLFLNPITCISLPFTIFILFNLNLTQILNQINFKLNFNTLHLKSTSLLLCLILPNHQHGRPFT